MHIDDLLDERERLLDQRASILKAMSPPVLASDLEQEPAEGLRTCIEQALDDAFFDLLDPIEREIEDHEAATAWQRQRADIIHLRDRQ